MAFITNTKDTAVGFPLFYRAYRTPLDFPKALEALNGAIDFSESLPDGRNKTEFFVYTSRDQFEQIMNPDRDPENFKKNALSQKYSDPTMSEEEKIKVAREMIIRDANFKRAHFNFQDINK